MWKSGWVDPYSAGVVDAAWETIKSTWGLTKFLAAWDITQNNSAISNAYYFTKETAEIREQSKAFASFLNDLALSSQARKDFKNAIATEFSEYLDEVVGLAPEAQYMQGKLLFDISTLFFGATEIKALLKGEKFSLALLTSLRKVPKDLLRILTNAEKAGLILRKSEVGIIEILSNEGAELAKVVNNKLVVRYVHFGGDIVCDEIKTTTCIGKWKPDDGSGTWIIIESKLSKYGENPSGVNILNDSRSFSDPQKVWDEINQPWLDEAITRNDIIRAVSDPLDIKNVFANTEGIPINVFSSPENLSNYLKNLNDLPTIQKLSFYGREIRHLSQNNYIFDLTTKTFTK